MVDLASLQDANDRLGRTLSDVEVARLSYLLTDASARVRSYTRQQITQSETTDRIRITARDGHVRLPQYPVVSITSAISVETQVAIPYYWDGLQLWGWGRFPSSNIESPLYNRSRRHGIVVDVTYVHGYETVPREIEAVVWQMAARALGSPPDQSGVTQESIAGYSYSIGSAAASGALGMLPAEQQVLDGYCAPNASAISLI